MQQSPRILVVDDEPNLRRAVEVALRLRGFEVDTAGHTADEQVTLDGHAWVPLTGLDDLPEPVWPACLAGIVAAATGDPSAWPGDVGRVEESTVPIGNLVDPGSRQD